MKRLEQILAVGHNMDRFRLLVKDIKREKLVVFLAQVCLCGRNIAAGDIHLNGFKEKWNTTMTN